MHNHHDTEGRRPYGSTNDATRTGAKRGLFLWPYRQDNMADGPNVPFYNPPHTIWGTRTAVCQERRKIYLCPSDGELPDQNVGTYQRTRGNVVNWERPIRRHPPAPDRDRGPQNFGPFFHLAVRNQPRTVGFAASSTAVQHLLLSETLLAKVASDNDWRGTSGGDGMFGPRSSPPTRRPRPDQQTTFFTPNNDPAMPPFCTRSGAAAGQAHRRGECVPLRRASVRQKLDCSFELMAMGSMAAARSWAISPGRRDIERTIGAGRAGPGRPGWRGPAPARSREVEGGRPGAGGRVIVVHPEGAPVADGAVIGEMADTA